MSKRKTRKTVTFNPSTDVKTMLSRACGSTPIWGYRSHLINEALREHLKKRGFARKREATP